MEQKENGSFQLEISKHSQNLTGNAITSITFQVINTVFFGFIKKACELF